MSDVALPLFIESISETLVDADGANFTLPDGKLGDTWIASLRFLERTNDDPIERSLNVLGVRAAIGPVLAPPTSGKFKLSIGGSITGAVNFSASAEEMLAAFGTGVGVSCSKPDACCWVARFTDDGEEPVDVVAAPEAVLAGVPPEAVAVEDFNTLSPQSFVRVRQYKEGGIWYHEIRLVQAPYAFADTAESGVPSRPQMFPVLDGAEETETDPAKNEIQKLLVPADFKGTFHFTFNGRRSAVVGGEGASIETIADALNGMYADGATRFKCTNPEKRYVYVEFTGSLSGLPQPLMGIVIDSAPAGPLMIRLPLDRAALASALRVEKTVTTVFEIEVTYIGEDEEPDDPDVVPRRLTAQADVRLLRELIYDELALQPSINWLKRMQRIAYVPFSPGAIITGSQYGRFVIGTGEATIISITHGMATEEIANIIVRQNIAGGRVLGPGEYTAKITDDDQIELTFAEAPALNSLVCIVSTINNVASFQDHEHPIAKIIGDTEGAPTLRDELNDLNARVAALEALVTITGGLTKTEAESADQGVDLPKRTELYPGHYAQVPKLDDPTVKLRPGRLFPAIHDAAVTAFTALPLPDPAGFAGSVFYNDTGADIQLRTRKVPVGGFFGSDGRAWLQLSRNDSTNSYFPTELERELWMLAINSSMLRPGMAFRVDGVLKLRMIVATTKMQALLVIEIGQAPSQSTPAPTSLNLQDVVWDTTTPLLEQRIVIGDVEQKHDYGCAIVIGSTGAVTATKFLYGGSSTADNKPSSANFVIRARLRDFDTENSILNAKGLIWYDSTGESAIK